MVDSQALFSAPDPGARRLAFEVGDTGENTDVESEDVGEPIDKPFDPEQIEVQTRNPTVSLLLNRIRRGTLDLAPDFQRNAGIWTKDAQSRLIESLLLRITLPTFYAAEADDDIWAVVDGVQRLTTIARFVDPESVGMPRLRLSGLEYLKDYNGATFDDLPGRFKTRIEETELVVLLIRRGTPEAVKFNIFARINTGGRPLTRQELRHALIPGRARSFLAELADSEEFKAATSHSISPDRMSDREMCLRFLAFILTPPERYQIQDFDGFLRDAMHQINRTHVSEIDELRRLFTRGMHASRQVLGTYAFRKHFHGNDRRSPVNKALFEAQAVTLARQSDRTINKLTSMRHRVEAEFINLMDDVDFYDSISAGTGDVGKVRIRFRMVAELFDEVIIDA
jgi:hypothetical protein